MNVEDLLIIVPARGGSKGLPRKNVRDLGGRPLLAWTRDAVLESGLAGARCILSTDDDEIAAVGRQIGLDVPFRRPEELANDTATAVDVAFHALQWFGDRDVHPEAVMWLQPTSPFRSPGALAAAVELLVEQHDINAVVGVKAIHRTLRTLYLADEAMMLRPIEEGEPQTRRQEVRTMFTPNGALYLVRTRILLETSSFLPPGTRGIEMNQMESLDLDDPIDWEIMEALATAPRSPLATRRN